MNLLRLLLLLPLTLVLAAAWFYRRYLRQTHVELAPGVHALIGGGGNSLVVEDGGDALLVDTKFPPCDRALRRWLSRHCRTPIGTIVNTHHHYDHTFGNALYPSSTIVAHHRTPTLMRDREDDFWHGHEESLPRELVGDEGRTLRVGSTDVVLRYPGVAHTHGDLYAVLPQQGIVATGDLLFHGFYPYLDTGRGGAWPPGMSAGLRVLAREHPDARFVPEHGRVCRAADLLRAADYLDWLWAEVGRARADGLSERETRRRLRAKRFGLSILPVAFPPRPLHLGDRTYQRQVVLRACWRNAMTDLATPPSSQTHTHSSRRSRAAAGWQCAEQGSFTQLEPPGPRPKFSWLRPSVLWASRNDVLARWFGDPTDDVRAAWVDTQRANGADPDFRIDRTDLGDSFSCLVAGDTGEGDHSQYAVVPGLLTAGEGTSFLVTMSDVIYPIGDVNDYIDKFFRPYGGYQAPIYALPGNHDWYDGLGGFMRHFASAQPLPPRPHGSGLKERIRDRLWRRPSVLGPTTLDDCRNLRPAETQQGQVPGPYWLIETEQLRFVAIDTGIMGGLDGDQGDWLTRVSAGAKPKVLLTGKPIYVNNEHHPGRKLAFGTRLLEIAPEQAAALIGARRKMTPTREDAVRPTLATKIKGTFVGVLPSGKTFHKYLSEFADWDEPPLFKHFLRLDVSAGALRIRCFAATGCRAQELEPPVEDDVTIPLVRAPLAYASQTTVSDETGHA